MASYLGHSNVAMTLNAYAEVDPDAKRAAVSKVEESFDMDMTSVYAGRGGQTTAPTASITFTVEQLEAMLAEARRSETGAA